jgi:hypothetical protein
MEKVFDQAPKIIAESSKSPLGIASLSILALSVVGYLFFRGASDFVRVSMFGLMFFGYGLLSFTLIQGATLGHSKGTSRSRKPRRADNLQEPRLTVAAGPIFARTAAVKSSRTLAALWFSGGAVLLALVTLQTWFGKYGDPQPVWAWLGSSVLPGVSVITAAFFYDRGGATVSRATHAAARLASILYLVFLLLTLLLQPLLVAPSEEVLGFSSLIGAPLQGVVTFTLTILLLSRSDSTNREP